MRTPNFISIWFLTTLHLINACLSHKSILLNYIHYSLLIKINDWNCKTHEGDIEILSTSFTTSNNKDDIDNTTIDMFHKHQNLEDFDNVAHWLFESGYACKIKTIKNNQE